MKLRVFLKFLFGLTIVFFLLWVSLICRIYKYSAIDEAQKSDAIIVLGASQWNGKPSPVLKNRLEHALSLYNLNYFNSFILTGGFGEDDNISESQAGKNYLMQKGVKEENIFLEENSRTTLQNLNEALKIIEQRDFDSVILVSNGFHSLRLKKMANNLGIKNYISSVKNGIIERDRVVNFKYMIRESVVYILYRLFKI